MPIHKPGPRLYSSIPFKYLAQKKHGANAGGVVNLNMTPFVDMMTILVCFLLMVFSADGELVTQQQGLTLPDATIEKDLRKAPIIVVSPHQIALDGVEMAKTEDLLSDESMEWKIVALYERLQAKMRRLREDKIRGNWPKYEVDNCKKKKTAEPVDPKKQCWEGLVILQADRKTTSKVLNRVLKTAYAAEYNNIMFAVNRRKTRAE